MENGKLHKYLKKKHPEKQVFGRQFRKNPTLIEKIHIEIKNSPVLIYKKKKIPTMKVDLLTALKEPGKVKHQFSSKIKNKDAATVLCN